ncbi:MBL fold metallo-hydrolase [Peribacillus glennii]|uniref:MBL fold metallo-hydrolase n=1 Tax=Peribacillus glennii TaxID=2303991 RepID=A0A372L720_9BACI|nr:MBL fold metallo-hydrolase [Peribacillus glennii]RFU60928.1 MBL fold metallo-hydrolase [Peribacillus glennii]
MEIAKGVEILELKIEAFGTRTVLNPVLVWDENSAILIDCGMPGQLGDIRSAMEQAGVSLERLTGVVITHQDLDHIGSLPALLKEVGKTIPVYAHELDKPYIEGALPLIKTDPKRMSKEQWEALPEPARAFYANPPSASVDKILSHGEELPVCGGIEILHTPGHTPGHISLYLHKTKTMIAGDSMVCVNGTLFGPVEQTTPDMATAKESIKKYLDYDIDHIVCYHGGLVDKGVKEQLLEVAVNWKSVSSGKF